MKNNNDLDLDFLSLAAGGEDRPSFSVMYVRYYGRHKLAFTSDGYRVHIDWHVPDYMKPGVYPLTTAPREIAHRPKPEAILKLHRRPRYLLQLGWNALDALEFARNARHEFQAASLLLAQPDLAFLLTGHAAFEFPLKQTALPGRKKYSWLLCRFNTQYAIDALTSCKPVMYFTGKPETEAFRVGNWGERCAFIMPLNGKPEARTPLLRALAQCYGNWE